MLESSRDKHPLFCRVEVEPAKLGLLAQWSAALAAKPADKSELRPGMNPKLDLEHLPLCADHFRVKFYQELGTFDQSRHGLKLWGNGESLCDDQKIVVQRDASYPEFHRHGVQCKNADGSYGPIRWGEWCCA